MEHLYQHNMFYFFICQGLKQCTFISSTSAIRISSYLTKWLRHKCNAQMGRTKVFDFIFTPPKRRKTWKSIMTPKQFSNNADETADEETPTSNVGGTGQHQGRGHRHSKSRKWSLTPSIFFITTITVIISFTTITLIIRKAISIIIFVRGCS